MGDTHFKIGEALINSFPATKLERRTISRSWAMIAGEGRSFPRSHRDTVPSSTSNCSANWLWVWPRTRRARRTRYGMSMAGYEHNYAQMGALPSIRVFQEEDVLGARPAATPGGNARSGFRIMIFDNRTRGDNLETAVGAGGCSVHHLTEALQI